MNARFEVEDFLVNVYVGFLRVDYYEKHWSQCARITIPIEHFSAWALKNEKNKLSVNTLAFQAGHPIYAGTVIPVQDWLMYSVEKDSVTEFINQYVHCLDNQ